MWSASTSATCTSCSRSSTSSWKRRSRQLGAPALGTLKEFLDHAALKEQPGDYPDSYTMLSNLCGDHEVVIQWLRQAADDCDEKYHDMGTNDFLIGLMQDHEKMAWMLRSYLEERR